MLVSKCCKESIEVHSSGCACYYVCLRCGHPTEGIISFFPDTDIEDDYLDDHNRCEGDVDCA